MKIQKGMFSTVPVSSLDGEHPYLQVIYMRMCKYANESGQCRPSMNTLARNCNISRETVRKYIPILVEKGYIKKTTRYNDKKDEYSSNLYDVFIKEPRQSDCPPRQSDCPPRQPQTLGGGQSNTQELDPYSGTKFNEPNSKNLEDEKESEKLEVPDASEPSSEEDKNQAEADQLKNTGINAHEPHIATMSEKAPMTKRREYVDGQFEKNGIEKYGELLDEDQKTLRALRQGKFQEIAERHKITTAVLAEHVIAAAQSDPFRCTQIFSPRTLQKHYRAVITNATQKAKHAKKNERNTSENTNIRLIE